MIWKTFWKDERTKKGIGNVCNSKIILEIDNKNIDYEQKYKMIKAHGLECKNFEIITRKIKSEINKWEEFKDKNFNFLENIDNYENKTLIKEIHKIFQKESSDFSFNKKKFKFFKSWKKTL